MKKILIFAFLLLITIVSGCSQTYVLTQDKSYILGEIQKANYCETKDDCVDAGGKCPFDCYIYVNKNEVGRIKALLDSYESNCIYDCAYCPDVECRDGKCKAVCE